MAQNLPKLHTISIKIITRLDVSKFGEWVAQSLATLLPTESVRRLSFTIFALASVYHRRGDDDGPVDRMVFPEEFFADWNTDAFNTQWQLIGKAIKPDRLPSLRRVSISTFGTHAEAEDPKNQSISWLGIWQPAGSRLPRAS